IPVWAHPWLFRGGNIEGMVYEMAEAGLMGLEVYHPGHTPSQQARLTIGLRANQKQGDHATFDHQLFQAHRFD
ncbi:MAG: hypothetical protein AAGA85_18870, partial [Bacteroidota bacterium]